MESEVEHLDFDRNLQCRQHKQLSYTIRYKIIRKYKNELFLDNLPATESAGARGALILYKLRAMKKIQRGGKKHTGTAGAAAGAPWALLLSATNVSKKIIEFIMNSILNKISFKNTTSQGRIHDVAHETE